MMSGVLRNRKPPLSDHINKILGEFPDFKCDSAKIFCLVCKQPLLCWDKRDCIKHINTAQHKHKKIA